MSIGNRNRIVGILTVAGLFCLGQAAKAGTEGGMRYQVCKSGSVACYYCNGAPSPGGSGCTNGKPPLLWMFGYCAPSKSPYDVCTQNVHNCGWYVNCTTNALIGTCASLSICN